MFSSPISKNCKEHELEIVSQLKYKRRQDVLNSFMMEQLTWFNIRIFKLIYDGVVNMIQHKNF